MKPAPAGGDRRRLHALLLIAAYAALCGVPVWWRTTSVPRPPLPHARMRALGERLAAGGGGAPAAAAALPVRLDVHVAGLGGAEEEEEEERRLEPLVREALEASAARIARLDVAVRPPLDAAAGAELGSPSLSPEAADALLLEALGAPGEAGRYALVVVPRQDNASAATLTIGKHRHAWAALPAALWRRALKPEEEEEAGVIAADSSALAAAVAEAAALALSHAFGLWADGDGDGDGDDASSPLFSPGGLVLSFSLVNGDPPPAASVVEHESASSNNNSSSRSCPAGYAWDFAALERARLAPLLDALRLAAGGGPATIGAESAVLQLSPAGAEGAWRALRGLGGDAADDDDEEDEEEEEDDDGYEDLPTGDDEDDAAASAAAARKEERRRQRQQRSGKVAGAYVLSQAQLPAFADSEWPFESGRGVLSSAAVMHRAAAAAAAAATKAAASGRGGGGEGEPGAADDELAQARAWARERDRSAALLAPHVLHFVAFVPRRGQRPLLVADAAAAVERSAGGGGGGGGGGGNAGSSHGLLGSGVDPAVNGYWIPSWGGVFIWNPQEQQQEEDEERGATAAAASPPPPLACPLPAAAAAAATRAFATQLRALLGLPAHGTRPASTATSAIVIKSVRLLPSPEKGLSDWEMDALSRARVRVGAASAARTLRALSEVVSELPNLGMPDIIGAQVAGALDAADALLGACDEGRYGAAALAAAAASAAADAAYLHPSVLSQLNFPDSHKLGVYMPYFLPASVPLVQGLAREAKRRSARRQ